VTPTADAEAGPRPVVASKTLPRDERSIVVTVRRLLLASENAEERYTSDGAAVVSSALFDYPAGGIAGL
jgi:hypothetical protein